MLALVHPDDVMHKLQVDAHSDDTRHQACMDSMCEGLSLFHDVL